MPEAASSPRRPYSPRLVILLGIVFVALVVVIVWSQSQNQPAPAPGYVSRAMLGDDWPLTVEEGQLRCIEQAVTIVVDGTAYALNGVALQRDTSRDITPIWADNPTVEGLKKDLGPLIERGLALCN